MSCHGRFSNASSFLGEDCGVLSNPSPTTQTDPTHSASIQPTPAIADHYKSPIIGLGGGRERSPSPPLLRRAFKDVSSTALHLFSHEGRSSLGLCLHFRGNAPSNHMGHLPSLQPWPIHGTSQFPGFFIHKMKMVVIVSGGGGYNKG